MSGLGEAAARRLARLAARTVVARPALWPLFRGPLRSTFSRLAPVWEGIQSPDALSPLAAALERVDPSPARVLDLGTGTGKAARFVAARFPEADVVGVDLSPAMVERARELLAPELRGRVAFEVGDASALRFEDGAFDLVVLLNMIPFFGELARVLAPGGTLAVASTNGPATPIWTPPEALRAGLAAAGFAGFEELAAGTGTALLARRGRPG
ncbi:MAG TPA: class I SAM-dependent methyltransferase [Gaiellaceae bacterium]|nr:class I SAM-dependent methyltransferase [Gaiellaceae bacterium]